MTSERKIWEATLLLYHKHDARALAVAEDEAAMAEDDEREHFAVVWRWIARSVAELLRSKLRDGEYIN
ncbi:MAG TPA: hypothetical protein VJK53_02075 [Candidatus Paceibacterota bacterium]